MKLLPLDAPGLKPPGPTFITFAEKITGVSLKEKIEKAMQEAGRTRKYTAIEQTVIATKTYRKTIRNLLKRCLASAGDFEMPMPVGRDKYRPMPVVSGRIWGSDQVGPVPARVMVIDKIVNEQQRNTGLAFASDQGDILQEACDMAGIDGYEDWYVTNVIKTEHPQASKTTNLSSQMLHDWLPALQQEIRIVQPDFILCLGADAVRALFGKNQTLKSIEGRVVEYEYSVGVADADGNVPHKKALVTATISPNYVLHEPEVIDQLELGVSRFGQLVSGGRWDRTEEDIEHYVIDSIDELKQLRKRIRKECVDNLVAIDAEWHGDHPENKGSYLRTFQISWAHKKACCVSLRHPGGKKRFKGSFKHCARIINSILEGRVIAGHFLVADAEWLEPFGVKLREFMRVPNNWIQFQECVKAREGCGFDTGYAWHSLAETADFGLKDMSLRFTEAPRYDVALQECVKQYCSEHKLKAEQLEGYGFIPDDVLEPYALYDACVTRRIAVKLIDMLDADQFGNSCWEPFWINMRMWPVILEINRSGLPLDKDRVDSLTDLYIENRDWLLKRLRKIARWPDFNINSVNQLKEFLFGERYNGVVNKEDPKARVRLRPEKARTLGLTPVLTTDKRPMVWTDVVEKGLEDEKSPSTKSSALVLMAEEVNAADPSVFARIKTRDRKTGDIVEESFSRADVVNLVRDYKFISQILKNVLRPPLLDTETEQYLLDDDENYVYEKGFAAACCDDGRVRTHVYPTKETGRWATSRPPTQNFAKRREEEYKRILQDDYQAPLRSVVKADEGTVLIEADYIGAELFAMAMLSGDEKMLEHTRRNTLPEDHPDYYDIHSNIAVMAFNLDCAPTKSALKAIKKAQLRIVAKCVPGHVRLQTDQGWLRMETLCGQVPKGEGVDVSESGIHVGSLKGTTPLLSLYNAGKKRCVRIETERGYRLDAAGNHRIVTMAANGKLDFKKAKDITPDDYVALRMGDDVFGSCVEFPQIDWIPKTNFRNLSLPKKFSTDWAAFLGLYLAEGGLDGPTGDTMQISLACEDDPEFAEATEQLLRRIFGDRLGVADITHDVYQNQKKFSVSSVKLAAWLRENATTSCETHRIPEFVFKWPKRLQSVFLRWLFEGDGSVKRNGAGVSIGYSTASEALARDVQLLLTNFGIETSLAAEHREDHAGTYWVLGLFGNEARARFAEQIGFVTAADRETYEAGVANPSFNCDRRIIPNQVEYLRAIMSAVPSPVKEKCRECVRANSRVQLSPSRLRLILEHVVETKLDEAGRAAHAHLKNLLGLPLVFQQVRATADLGVLPCYDVETTPENLHVVNFDGFATHQSVVFGVAYGRQAKAIALAAREEKIFITVEQAQATIDALFRLYPKLKPFFAECQSRAIQERWLMNSYGRSRRFGVARQSKTIGDYQRQAMNFPVQGLIADAVSRAMNNLAIYREEHPEVDFRFKLQVHDAIMLQAPYSQVATICDEVLPLCMVTNNPIYPCRLDGYPMGNKPYYLGIDTSIAHHWGELMYPDECKAAGILPMYAGWVRHRELPGYVHVEEKKGFIWQKGKWNPLAS